MIIKGDCKIELKKIESNTIDLIYLDPPFFHKENKLKKLEITLKNILLVIVGKILIHIKDI